MSSLKKLLKLSVDAPPVPAGWKTREQLMQEEGISSGYVDRFFSRCIECGLLERKMWKVRGSDGVVRPRPIFRRTKKGGGK